MAEKTAARGDLLEPLICKPLVGGSILSPGTKQNKRLIIDPARRPKLARVSARAPDRSPGTDATVADFLDASAAGCPRRRVADFSGTFARFVARTCRA